MVTDQPAYELAAQNSTYAQDIVAPEGIARMRKGFSFDGNTADVADNLVSVHRNKFVLADATRTVTGDDDGDLFIHNASSAGTALYAGAVQYLPRCVYRDEVIWCAQDGVTPLRRHSGAAFDSSTSATVATVTAGNSILTATTGTWSALTTSGSYANLFGSALSDAYPHSSLRVLERISSTVLSLEDFRGSFSANVGFTITGTGTVYPCVSVYSAGTGTFDTANDRFTGTGVVFTGGAWGSVSGGSEGDGLMTMTSTSRTDLTYISSVFSATALSLGTTTRTDADLNYAILRRAPFTDAAAHKGSFWGTGVAQSPNSVYVGPPGWNLSFPPGFLPPFEPGITLFSANANDFLMDSINVPSAYDGDINVAILSSPGPLLVLKRSAVYGISGSFPNFSTDKITDNAGCIDIRSAISGPNGQFWAGEEGIFAFIGGQVIDLTEGKINREWRALTRVFDYGTADYCTIGETYDHLFVSIVTGGGTTNRCYVYDLRNQSWISRFSNHKARYFFSSQVDGEPQELYWVGDNDQGRVMKSSATVNGTGLAKDGDGDSPVFTAYTPQNIDGDGSIEGDERLLDLAVHANVYDTAGLGTTLGVSVVSGGSLEATADATKTLTAITSDNVDRVDRHYFRTVNSKGRLQQIRLASTAVGSNNAFTKIEVPEITATFRSRRDRS